MKLKVEKLPTEDSWGDIVRIPKAFRKDDKGRPLHRGKVCRVGVGKKSKWAILRGLDSDQPVIRMDLNLRIALGVKKGNDYEFSVKQVGWVPALFFPWRASDPAYRLPAQLSIIAFFLGVVFGVLGVVVGLIPIYLDHQKAPKAQSSGYSALPSPGGPQAPR